MENESELILKQHKSAAEVLSGWSVRNRYSIESANGTLLARATERTDHFMERHFRGKSRPFKIDVSSPDGQILFTLSRARSFFTSKVNVTAPDGTLLGRVNKLFTFFGNQIEIVNSDSERVAKIVQSFFPTKFKTKPHTTRIQYNPTDSVGQFITSSSVLRISFNQDQWNAQQKNLFLAATILIQVDIFDSHERVLS